MTSALELLDVALARARRDSPCERPLRIALTPSVIFGTLQDLLEAVAETGLAEPEVRDVWADELPAAVRDGRFDVGLAVEIDPGPGLAVEPWRRQRVDLLVAEAHPFAVRGEVRVEELHGTTLVIPERTAHVGWHARLADTLARAEVRPTIAEAPHVARARARRRRARRGGDGLAQRDGRPLRAQRARAGAAPHAGDDGDDPAGHPHRARSHGAGESRHLRAAIKATRSL